MESSSFYTFKEPKQDAKIGYQNVFYQKLKLVGGNL
jgi:hypothetical protein